MRQWGKGKGATVAQISLAWLLSHKTFIVPIPGTSQIAHMQENIKATDVHFTPDDWRDFNAGFSQIQIVGAPNHELLLRGQGVEAKPQV